MAAPLLLIDGYNLLHAAGWMPAEDPAPPHALEHSRVRLLHWLAAILEPETALRTTVVFDARHPPGDQPSAGIRRGIRILFATETGEADELIEQLIAEHPHPKGLTVVSSDRRLQAAARHRRAAWLTSDQFLEASEKEQQAAQQRKIRGKPAEVPSAHELEEWLEIFADAGNVSVPDPAPIQPLPAEAPRASLEQPETVQPDDVTSAARPRRRNGQTPAAEPGRRPAGDAAFSSNWLEDLQKWVDDEQRRTGRSRP